VRILALNWTDWRSRTAGGSEVHLLEMFRRWVEAGHEVTLACGFHAGLRDLRDRTHAEVDRGIEILRSGPWYLTHLAVPRLARRLLHERRYDVVLDAVNKLPFFAPRWAGPVPVLALVHHLFGKTIERDFGWLRGRYSLALERRIPAVYGTTPLVAISGSTKSALVELGIPADHVEIVECGLDPSYLEPPEVSRDPDPLLLVVSRLRAYKRVDVVIEALAFLRERLPRARLLIAGTGTDEARLRSLVRRRGLGGAVSFVGHVSEEEKRRLLARAHLFCTASEIEGWGLTVIEANALRTPVLAADSPGHRDSVRNGATGLLFPPGDARALASLAFRLLTNEREAKILAIAGRAWAEFGSWDETARQTLEILEDVASCAWVPGVTLPPARQRRFWHLGSRDDRGPRQLLTG
jgi:glycosyltransferase involved in cell wall biosynthesis